MANDAYAARDLGDGTHDHPWLKAHDIALARTTTTSRRLRDASGRPMVLSHDHRLSCGHLVSAVTAGAIYPNSV